MATGAAPLVVNALTIDVEDYFQVSALAEVVPRDSWPTIPRRVVANTERILSVLDATQVKGTFFVLGWIAEREPALVRRIAASGHEIASHGYGHQLVYDQTPDEFREDVRRSKALLESLTGQPILGYRAPSFSITDRSLWAVDVLIEEGFRWDASVFPIHHDRYGIPNAPRDPHWIWHHRTGETGYVTEPARVRPGGHTVGGFGRLLEIPASTVSMAGTNLPVGGGGYFRLLPYAWTSWGIRRLNRVERRPAVFYLHPWELDPEQPRLPASRLSRFRHYRNLAKTEGRLRRLLRDFAFAPIRDAVVSMAPTAA